jgi:hypothetical protein
MTVTIWYELGWSEIEIGTMSSRPLARCRLKQQRRNSEVVPSRRAEVVIQRGRPLGARNAATRLAEQLLDGEAAAITRKAIALAKSGDRLALRLCMDRIVPPRRDRPGHFAIPELNSAADASKAIASITQALAHGQLGFSEAAELSKLIETYIRAVEATELEKRLAILEQRFK